MSEDTKLQQLIINTLSPEQMPEVLSDTEIYLVEDEVEYASIEELATKQDKLTAGKNITIENNIISSKTYHPDIFSTKWSDHLINDIQWLRADTFSWQSGDVYVTAYNTLVEEYNNTAEEETEDDITFKRSANGFKIATADMESEILNKYNTDGIAWYYILDTTNKRFKLPRTKFGFEGIRTQVGYDITESLPNIKGLWNGGNANFAYGLNATGALKAYSEGKDYTYTVVNSPATRPYGITLNASLSSSTYQDNAPVQERATQMYLYFYVGEYSRDAIEQTAGITTEQLNAKVDIDSSWGFPSNRYIDLTLGASGTTYTASANGWYYLRGVCNSAGAYAYLTNTVTNMRYTTQTYTSNTTIAGYLPCKKGDVISCEYSNFTKNYFRFIYAEGSN